MLAGSTLVLDIFSPDLENRVTQTVETIISDTHIEMNDVSFYDLSGDPYDVVAGQFDVTGTVVRYTLLEGGIYASVPDDGFNGYVLTFAGIAENDSLSIRKVRVLDDYNTLNVPSENVTTNGSNLAVNVDGLPFSRGEMLSVVLDMRMSGDNGRDIFEGGEGNDLLIGRKGRDLLSGGSGRDILKGGSGSDTLDGGAGNDRLFGGKGADTFVLKSFGGKDKIRDFETGDTIQVETSANGFSDLVLVQRGDHALVRDDGASLLLLNTEISVITEDAFIF